MDDKNRQFSGEQIFGKAYSCKILLSKMMGGQLTDALMQKIGPISPVGPLVAEETGRIGASVLVLEGPLIFSI